ncbi:hypothetical protein SLA2020_353200 [Shorea laevis]
MYASIIPCSIGVNPALNIATAAEYVSKHLVKDIIGFKREKGTDFHFKSAYQNPCVSNNQTKSTDKGNVLIKEVMRGYVGGMPCTAFLKIKIYLQDQKSFDEDLLLRGKVGGYVIFRVIDKEKLHIMAGEMDIRQVDYHTSYTHYMHYHLLLASSSGSKYVLEGRKAMNPYLFPLHAWRDMTSLHVTLRRVVGNLSTDEKMNLQGELRISMIDLLKSLVSLEGNGRRRFIRLFLETLLRTYIFQVPRGSHRDHALNVLNKSCPSSTLHEIRTEDVQIISCRQWKNNSQRRGKHLGRRKLNPVLLLNGRSTESYYLSTEPNDLVRTLLEEGLEIHICNSGFIVDSRWKRFITNPSRENGCVNTMHLGGTQPSCDS